MNLDWNFFEEKYPLLMTSLKNARSAGRLTHAHLVCSANADYRASFPALLASLAACEHPAEDFTPCGICPTCRELLEGTYPDTFLLAPSSLSRIIPVGESVEEVDSMRWFEAQFYLSSMSKTGWKIGIVHEADRMNENAQNAFLKTLEEPPEKCIFILTTAHPAELLPTIRSRCQAIQLTDNRCIYRFPFKENLLECAEKLLFQSKNQLLLAEECSSGLIAILSGLKQEAQKTVAEKWKTRMEQSENLEASGLARLEKRIKAEESTEYLRMRESVLSCLHAYFAQAVLILSGAPDEQLPNPELLGEPFDPEKFRKIPPDFANHALNCAENLLRTLRTNANDELAIRSFCLKIAFK